MDVLEVAVTADEIVSIPLLSIFNFLATAIPNIILVAFKLAIIESPPTEPLTKSLLAAATPICSSAAALPVVNDMLLVEEFDKRDNGVLEFIIFMDVVIKLPFASRATIAPAVSRFVAVVALFATRPAVLNL